MPFCVKENGKGKMSKRWKVVSLLFLTAYDADIGTKNNPAYTDGSTPPGKTYFPVASITLAPPSSSIPPSSIWIIARPGHYMCNAIFIALKDVSPSAISGYCLVSYIPENP